MVLAQEQIYRSWNRIESSEINPHTYESSTKETRTYDGEKTVFKSAVGKT